MYYIQLKINPADEVKPKSNVYNIPCKQPLRMKISKHSRFKEAIYLLILLWGFFQVATADLYNNKDPMVLLNVSNFYDKLLKVENAWIVEFYASWCGHCINFAPKWKQFSHEVVDWDHTIKVAVIDCADEENVPVCREFDVNTYPTIRLFGTDVQRGDFGSPLKKGNPTELQTAMIAFLIDKEKKNLGSPSWVDLLEYKEPISKILDSTSMKTEYGVIIIEEPKSIIGNQVILDLGNYPKVYVRRMERAIADSVGVNYKQPLPSVISLDRNGNIQYLDDAGTTREEITAYLLLHFNLRRHSFDFDTNLNVETSTSAGRKSKDPVIAQPFLLRPDRVYMVDIENALAYAFSHEVSIHKDIDGENLAALKHFVRILLKYLPTRPPVQKFLKDLNATLSNYVAITGEEFENIMKALNPNDSLLPGQKPWVGCLGSDPKYRGYPCGLWVTFHTLTVNAALREEGNPEYNPLDVMRAIHGYVKHFFSCRYCSQHFQNMYANDAESSVKVLNDEIIWFWKAHNKVNRRLKGDRSEDPSSPKIPFPSNKKCPQCWVDGTRFDKPKVLEYLKQLYGESSISYAGVYKRIGDGTAKNSFSVNESSGTSDDSFNKFWYFLTSLASVLGYLL